MLKKKEFAKIRISILIYVCITKYEAYIQGEKEVNKDKTHIEISSNNENNTTFIE